MFVERPLKSLKAFYPGAIWRIKHKDKNVLYLTFDDGPVPEVTPRVLDILDSYGVKATFFCVGENVEKNPALYQDILSRGHAVGNHTHNHLKGFETSNEAYFENIRKASTFIQSKVFRPPYGRIKPAQLKALKKEYTIVLWDLITRDYNPKLSPNYIIRKIRLLSRNGSVVVFHDSTKAEKNLFAVLPQAIEYWQSKGFVFEVL